MISTILIICLIVLAGIGFNIQARREVRERRLGKESGREDELPADSLPYRTRADESEEHCDGIARTIELIGEKAYREMKARIDRIVSAHENQRCVNVSLTCGPDTFDGAHELHRLLPGQALNLVTCAAGGVETIDVYFNGARVGRLALNDAETIREVMKGNKITGVYVAEQNCYGLAGSHQMDIIIFYDSKQGYTPLTVAYRHAMRMLSSKQPVTANICQN